MSNIIIGERVINKIGASGTILSCDENYIYVDYKIRIAKIQKDAFLQGLLKYANPDLQSDIDKIINGERLQKEQLAEEKRAALAKADEDRKRLQAMMSMTHFRVAIASASIRLDPAELNLNHVRKCDKSLIEEIFALCDSDSKELYETITPRMEYLKGASKSRSKYCVAFLTKYLNTYVFRVFSRNDIYSKGSVLVNVRHSDTTEVLRILSVNNKLYYFSKNLIGAAGYLVNTKSRNEWHVSDLNSAIMLNEVIKYCDCGYLNNYISEKNIDCFQYTKLLFPAFYNNKVEIIFKNRLFAPAYRIKDIEEYLDKYSSKQIDFASKNNLLNALPVIKRFGNLDLDVLKQMESVMRKRRNGESIYSALECYIENKGFSCGDLTKKLISFIKKVDIFNPAVYYDYIHCVAEQPNITIDDFFDKHYIDRHNVLAEQQRANYTMTDIARYSRAYDELSWINREENGYYIIVPENLSEFRKEGDYQHNCVFTRRYYLYVVNNMSIIVFLRKEENTPYVTIEYDYETFEVLQAYGKYNRDIDSKLYKYIVELGKRLNYERHSQQ